jgi:hypothetical protein
MIINYIFLNFYKFYLKKPYYISPEVLEGNYD